MAPNADTSEATSEPISFSASAPSTADWYAKGRAYGMSVAYAYACTGRHKSDAAALHLEAADRQLWPLEDSNAGELRDFIAGAHCEVEVQLAAMRGRADSRRHASASTDGLAADSVEGVDYLVDIRVDRVFRGVDLDGLTTEGYDLIDRLLHALIDAANPPVRLRGFCELGICEFEARILQTDSNDSASDGPALDRVFDVIATMLTTANRRDLMAFIGGQRFAHSESL